MSSNAHNGYAQRAAHWVGHVWQKLLRGEKQLAARLVQNGVPVGVSRFAIWVIRFAALAAILSVSFVFVLLIATLALIARALANADPSIDRDQPEWRNGVSGFGLYNQEGYRIDPHNFDNE